MRGLTGNAKSYAERLFKYPNIGALSEADAALAIASLDESFFKVRFDRMTPTEKKYLRAMAELGPGPHRSGVIAELFGKEVASLAMLHNKLKEYVRISGCTGPCSSFYGLAA